ncbi:RHS repeat domain-containing protein [Pseudomonas sp. NFX98]|uniref:RHS repeat domain-containing protein n=1 Tax=Pseudomonas sp. NFX98 TaxID=3399122 RepID=UPI0039FC309B
MTTSTAQPTSVHSNAFNFQSFVQPGVDQRTGLYTVSLSFPEVKSCDLSGPAVPLTLGYSPINTVDNGYGKGWRLGLTQYTPSTQIISVHSGESFKVTGSDPAIAGRLTMKEQKIETFKLYELSGNPLGQYKVVHNSGLVEILKLTGTTPQVAMPVKMYSPQGHEVTLAYQAAGQGRMLSTIRDSQGVLLEVLRNLIAKTVDIQVKPVAGVPAAMFILQLEGDLMTRVTLPTANNAGWRFLYGLEREQLCIKEVWTPLGGHETIQYNDAGHGYPGNPGYPNLPRVTSHVTEPGAGQPPIELKYTYSDNGNNFLGYNSTVDWSDEGEDNLYKVIGPYQYETTESLMVAKTAVRIVTRTFNRFHLMTQEQTTQGNAQKTLKTVYYANDTETFEKQDRRCQLPRQATELWQLSDDPRYWRQNKKITEYDIHGNLTLTVQDNGIREAIAYYPAIGAPGDCPPDPYGFVRHIREKTVTPSADSARIPELQEGAATLRSRYRYELMPPISGSTTPWVALIEERLLEVKDPGERLLQRAVYSYINAPTDHLAHGRRQRQALTVGETPGYTTFTDYNYSKHAATFATFAGETVLRTVETLGTDFDSVSKSVTYEHSLLNGEPILISDKDEQLKYTYDALGRVVTETEAPNTPYPASRTFSYTLIRPAGQGETPVSQWAGQEMEDVKKVRVRTWFDGLNRSICEEQQDLDNAGGSPPVFRRTYEASYNALSEVTSETEIDWLEKIDLRLTTTYTYDLWGNQDSATGPDGITRHTRSSPIGFITEQWTEGMGKSVTLSNRFDKPVKSEQFDLSGQRVSLHRYKYDGLGHCTEEIDTMGRITRFHYDAHARLFSNTLPDRTVIRRSYAAHTITPLVASLTVQPGNVLLPSILVGEQQFDGLERLTKMTVGGRVEQLHYEAGRLQPSRRITPAGKQIDYEYKPGLTTQPTMIKPPEGDSNFDYDLLNGNLESSSNARGTNSFSYTNAGHLSVESWKDAATPDPWVTRYTSSLKGRQLSRTDVGGQVANADYDLINGRLLSVRQCQLQADFSYDNCGRNYRTVTTDSGTGNNLTTTLAFDDIGRETSRTLVLRNAQGRALQPERRIELTYLADGNVSTRHLSVDGITALLETFEYDLRGRLEVHGYSGTDLPKDRFGHAMLKQYFEFDALDNIIYSRTDFADGRRNIAEYGFAVDDPCQLAHVTHSHPDYKALLLTDYSYDADGNLTHDELGQQLHYDSQGRLLSLSTPQGQPLTDYAYDAHDHLVAVKPAGQAELLRFYEGTRLSDMVQDGQHTQLLQLGAQPLGQQVPGDDSKTLLLLTDAKQSVIGESQADELRTAVYNTYGERSSDDPLHSLLAFNGEVRDPMSGWYLLGRGYRAYNPFLMRFHSPDSLSPFGAGGINSYMYCSGNPIALSDPTGHTGQSSKIIRDTRFMVASGAVAVGLGIFLSIVTFNPMPLALGLSILAIAAGASTATVVNIFNAVFVITTAITVLAKLWNWTSLGAGFGVGGASFAAKDQKQSDELAFVGLGLDFTMFPMFKANIRPALPDFSSFSRGSSSASSRKASSASNASTTSNSSNDVYDFMNRPPSGENWSMKGKPTKVGNYFPPQFMQNRMAQTLEHAHLQNDPGSRTGIASPYSGTPSAQITNRSTIESSTAESFTIDSIPAPRVQEWLGPGMRQAVHKPILSFAYIPK